MPAATFNAFRDHGRPRARLVEGMEQALATMSTLSECKVDMEQVTEKLLVDGERLFSDSFDQIMSVISRKRQELLGPKLIRQSYALGALDTGVQAKLKELRQTGFVRRLWAKDPTLWHSDPLHQTVLRNAPGWLHVT